MGYFCHIVPETCVTDAERKECLSLTQAENVDVLLCCCAI